MEAAMFLEAVEHENSKEVLTRLAGRGEESPDTSETNLRSLRHVCPVLTPHLLGTDRIHRLTRNICAVNVCAPSCIPPLSVCVRAAVCSWSWFRSWSSFWCWFVLLQDTVWIRSTVWSSAVPPPPCLDTQSCCIATNLTNG
ncbi:unnamed protein product [Pleuronectes platessa]|uniref:Uncharacterized protein n=1 Tax=Pleuronectes platessa TaxID=8262 RepID=A0A9N7UJV1_PLEPL|nr:unnamed protein product [Pleuronectes platessa]